MEWKCLLEKIFELADSCVADKRVETVECLDGFGDEGGTGLWVGDVAGDYDDATVFDGRVRG